MAGSRRQEWPDVVDQCRQEDFADFVGGPSELLLVLSPLDRHLMFKQMARLQTDQWGVQEHEHCMRYVELVAEYDQLDLTNYALEEAVLCTDH